MRISRKIGISFFVTFFLVILLGGVSIFSLKQIYRGLDQVFTKDLPASRYTYQIAISMENVLSELTNFLVTDNENFKASYERSYKKLQDDMSSVERFIIKEEEKELFEKIKDLTEDINRACEEIFKNRLEIKGLFKDMMALEARYGRRLDELFKFEEARMLEEQDILLIQTQYMAASSLIMESKIRFSNLLNGLVEYAGMDEGGPASIAGDILVLEKSIRDYKNFYGYSLSDKERSSAAELIDSVDGIKLTVNSIVGLKGRISSNIDFLSVKEGEFRETLDRLIAIRKSGISSKLGVGATLTEDIPAIYNISKLEKDIAESWRISGRYILTGDEAYRDLYFQLRQGIDKELKDYGRHARLRDKEKFLDDIVSSDNDIVGVIDSNMKVFDGRKGDLSSLFSIKSEIEKVIDELVKYKDSLIKEAKEQQKVLEKSVPARWLLLRLKDELSAAYRVVMNYLNEQGSQYKDMYSEIYFNMKKYLNSYRNLSSQDEDSIFIKKIEPELDRFNSMVLSVIDNYERIKKERGWTLVSMEEGLRKSLNRALEAEVSQIEKNKKDIRTRIAAINTFIFLIIGGVAVIAIFVIFYTTKSITEPIQKLYNGAEIIGGGNLDHRLDIKTGDEIEELAGGFNRMAGELKGLYTDLENKVKERTAQLAEANEALALKNKELDDFTYIVSHDLKEPLRGVKAFTKLLIEEFSGKMDKEGKEYLDTISDSSTRMTRLIEDLLNLSRIGRIKNIEPDVDFDELLSDVQKNLAYSLEEKKVDLRILANLPRITCDKIRISEVFSNLISNAVKYSKKGVRPVVELGYSDKGKYYEFYVKDNGIGIEKEYHDKVFQIFQRLHAKGEYEGTGAGLTIVKKIIENHGGKIWVESGPGEGSTFYFTLPKGQA